MALTVSQYPEDFTPAYNDQFFTALSDEYAQSDFFYNIECTVNGDTANTAVRRIYPDANGYMVFNAKEWVKNYIEHYFNPEYSTNFSVATNKSVKVQVTITEYYLGDYQLDDQEVFNYTAFDACLTEDEFYNYDPIDYVSGGNNEVIFLGQTFNDVVLDSRVTLSQQVWLHFTLGDIARAELTYDDGFNIPQVVNHYPVLASPSNEFDIYYLEIGRTNFTTPDVGATVTLRFFDVSDVQLGDGMTYTFTSICTKYIDYPVYYLNRFGNIPFFHFDKIATKKLNKKTNSVRLTRNTITAGEYTYNSWDREKHIVSTESDVMETLNTDWITESQSNQLQDLFDSPIVWKYYESKYNAVTVTNTTYEFRTQRVDKLFNYTIDVEYSNTKQRQRGI